MGLLVPDQEYEWIQSSLKRDLLRFPELEEFNADELRRLIIHWDDILVRWLQKFYRPMGIEVEHLPQDQEYPIRFSALPNMIELKLPKSLGAFKFTPAQVQDLVNTHGREGVAKQYLMGRLSELSTVDEGWPPPIK
ncbi:MAG: hypothetical protein ACFFB3_19000 [Candidatus Hodarchaeota archaeon]